MVTVFLAIPGQGQSRPVTPIRACLELRWLVGSCKRDRERLCGMSTFLTQVLKALEYLGDV